MCSENQIIKAHSFFTDHCSITLIERTSCKNTLIEQSSLQLYTESSVNQWPVIKGALYRSFLDDYTFKTTSTAIYTCMLLTLSSYNATSVKIIFENIKNRNRDC